MNTELSFDGKGINGPDPYRTRIATFTSGATDADVAKYGPLFAASPALLASVRELIGCADPHRDRAEIKRARAAVKQAEGGA
jgi:hypothetical protein